MAEILDIFNQDPFKAIALTDAVQRNPYQPNRPGAMNIFTPDPIRTKALAVEERTGKLVLIPFSASAAPKAPSARPRSARCATSTCRV
jgi:hypothetical protein